MNIHRPDFCLFLEMNTIPAIIKMKLNESGMSSKGKNLDKK
jgi:hypothetical protein